MMRNSNDHTLREVIAELLKEYQLSDKLKELKLLNGWPSVVGKVVNKHTVKIFYKQGKLYVTLDNAAMRHELHLARTRLIKSLNRKLGEDCVNEIIFK